MLNPISCQFKYGKHIFKLETGIIARQATSSVIASMDDTIVLISIVSLENNKLEQNFFPLYVNYEERAYAAGRVPGSFFRREGRPNENEILVSRLIDRPIRPLFPENLLNEIQIIATVISVNPEINPDIVAIIGTSAALSISNIPFKGPIGASRVGFINNNYVLNPMISEMSKSKLDLVISGTKNSILMVESEAKLLNEKQMLDAIIFGHEQQKIVIENINLFSKKVGNIKIDFKNEINLNLYNEIFKISELNISNAYTILSKKDRNNKLEKIKTEILNNFLDKNSDVNISEIRKIFKLIEKKIIRKKILDSGIRIDGRNKDEIRDIDIKINILPRTHGSSLFTRGETQALVTTTLGTERDAQNVDELIKDRTDRFLLHYNFPPYCTGEIGIMSSPKRREIGHGRLAKRSLLAVMPSVKDFPYTIRVVSEITESNGSSSMATVCGASLALMDAGVPIKSSIAGIAMGLIQEKNKFIILSDIIGDEDYLGDMDFKVSGSYDGITALQMDIKIIGISKNIIKLTLIQAKKARIKILDFMNNVINKHKKNISSFAPRIHTININPNKIKDIIGKGGTVIRALTEETNTTIEIKDNGLIQIAAVNKEKALFAIKRIKEITSDVEIGYIYRGKITKILNFGVFVLFDGNKEGLVHISQISNTRIKNIIDFLKIGQIVSVKVIDIDCNNRIKLSIKDAK